MIVLNIVTPVLVLCVFFGFGCGPTDRRMETQKPSPSPTRISGTNLATNCPTPAPSMPLVAPTSKATNELIVGQTADLGGIWFQVEKYHMAEEIEWSRFQRLSTGIKPPEGAKFLWLYVRAQNKKKVLASVPPEDTFTTSVKLLYQGTIMRRYSDPGHPAVLNDPIPFMCAQLYYGGEVYPEVIKEGWVLRVVPKTIELDKAVIEVANIASKALWRLGS